MTQNGGLLKDNLPTLPELFRTSNCWTGCVSKICYMGVPGNIYTGYNGADHPAFWTERFNVSVMEYLTPGTAEDVILVDSTPVYDEFREKWRTLKNKGGKLFIRHGNHQGTDFVLVDADAEDADLAERTLSSRWDRLFACARSGGHTCGTVRGMI